MEKTTREKINRKDDQKKRKSEDSDETLPERTNFSTEKSSL
jgi:hypothetical protein